MSQKVLATFEFQLWNYDIVVVSIADLGFTGMPSIRRVLVLARAIDQGLELCPQEAVEALREQYQNQPKNEDINVAMELPTDEKGNLPFGVVGCDETERKYISKRYSPPNGLWQDHLLLAFAKPHEPKARPMNKGWSRDPSLSGSDTLLGHCLD
jgi:hypothetical protein